MIIQVVAESLPISSSGHVVLMHKIMERLSANPQVVVDAWAFDYLLQGVSAFVFLCFFLLILIYFINFCI